MAGQRSSSIRKTDVASEPKQRRWRTGPPRSTLSIPHEMTIGKPLEVNMRWTRSVLALLAASKRLSVSSPFPVPTHDSSS
jgi:hypothetical protein